MKSNFFLFAIILFIGSLNIFGQLPTFPRASQRSAVTQTLGDTEISIVYHRPNAKGRAIWGCQTTDVIPTGATYDCLVPTGQVWRTGANEATVFEINNDVIINGKILPKGKYSLHTIPNGNEWTIIFNKTWDQWGSFSYDEKQDALRVTAKPVTGDMKETMTIGIEDVSESTANVVISWEKLRVPFKLDIGDVNKRITGNVLKKAVNDQFSAANFIFSSKMTDQYPNALKMLDNSISLFETFSALSLKARILADMGKKDEAIKIGEKAVEVGKKATPAANTSNFEKTLADWKSGK